MSLYDRYIDKNIFEKDLPDQIDFGRFCIIEDGGTLKDITYANFSTNKAIQQELLLEKNKSIQDIFIDIAIDIEKAGINNFNVIPLVRRIKNKLELNDFEQILFEKLFHLEEIFRVPHYLLEREIEKVNVSRAKRIPSKSYQYLASHTEDWIHKSIVNFKPSRILHEELELNYDVYENQLTIAFLERCLVYLNSRLKEIQDIKSFHEIYQILLNKDFSKGWYAKLNRNFKLMGYAYEDENYKAIDGIKDQKTLSKTEEKLIQINKRLLLLRKSELFNLVNKRVSKSISLRNTNVLVNHKHYRYIKLLWVELDKFRPEKSELDVIKFEQNVLEGLRSYGKSLISYTLENNLDFDLNGNYKSFKGQNQYLCTIDFMETEKGIFQLKIGDYSINIIVIGNELVYEKNLVTLLKQKHTFIFYYAEQSTLNNYRFININPLDPDSAERMGSLIRKYILMSFLDNINRAYIFKQLLKEYIHYLPTDSLEFDLTNYKYKFHSYPRLGLSFEDVKNKIENDHVFKTKSRPDKDNIIKSIAELLSEIESNSIKLKEIHLNCFNCGEKLQPYNIEKLSYIKCSSCNCLIDSSCHDKIVFKVDETKFLGSSFNEFGMDYLEFNLSDL